MTFSYYLRATTEPEFDYVTVEYDAGDENWVEIARYDGCLDTLGTHGLTLSQAATKLRFHFISDGAWDCTDHHYTCGAVSVDSLVVTDVTGEVEYEDFESAPLGAKESDSDGNGIYWRADVKTPYGLYSGLLSNLMDHDPFNDNLTSQVIFWQGSSYPNAGTPGYPGYFDTPFCLGPGGIKNPCQDEMIVSPLIDLSMYSSAADEVQDTPLPAGKKDFTLKYEVYMDLPLKNLVFYTWSVRNIIAGCPGQWLDRNYVHYSPYISYYYVEEDISDLVGTHPIQIGMRVVDMCDAWYDIYSDCAMHTPAPYFDNISIACTPSGCPKWYFRPIDLFQDNFPSHPIELESYVRADMANDIKANDDPVIDPGDSIVVQCASPQGNGLELNWYGPRVYMHVKVTYIGSLPAKPPISGSVLQGDYGRHDGPDNGWTVIQGEPAKIQGMAPAPDKYMFDLNDALFTRGYMIEYYFKAYDNAAKSSTLPKDAADGVYFEFTCLPTLASDILYVDDFHGRGSLDGAAQLFLDTSFEAVLPEDVIPDRYDVNGPSYMVSNGPGGRASFDHLIGNYTTIIWDSGNLRHATISDGFAGDKGNDCALLEAWLELSETPVNLWICGDNIASDLSARAAEGSYYADAVLSICGVELKHGSYYGMTGGSGGGNLSPEVIGVPPGPFFHGGNPVSFEADGTVSPVNSFDVLDPVYEGIPALKYPDWNAQEQHAGIVTDGFNSEGAPMKTVWIGVSYLYIRDITYPAPNDRDRSSNLSAAAEAPIARFQVMKDVFDFFGTITKPDITDEVPPKAYAYYLEQNYPNPFNPATTIKFGVKEAGPVTLKIYNVSGQLVATLIDEVMDAGHYTRHWDGRNSHGSLVASGIYFYKLNARNFHMARKIVLLR